MRPLIFAGALVALLAMPMLVAAAAAPAAPAHAATTAPATTAPATAAAPAACKGIGPTPEKLPATLVGAFLRAFGLTAPELAQGAVVRCAGGRLLACTPGANLPCGQADTRQQLPQADAWCAQHQNASFIPAFVTGHDTIYAWRCDGPRAAIVSQIAHMDRKGYVAEYWRPLGS